MLVTKKLITVPRRGQKKGDNGRLLIVGGSEQYVGAVTLSAIAALRAGCDWVTVAAPEKVAWAINCTVPDIVTIKLKGKAFSSSHEKIILKAMEKHDVLLIGNGMTTKPKKLIQNLCSSVKKPKVIDADALKVIDLNTIENTIFTPHSKELKILLKNVRVHGSVQNTLKNSIIIAKGATDKIITSKKTYENKTGNDAMTKAGTGDVLAGVCAGLLSQGLSLEQAAITGTYITGKAGDLLKKNKGFSFLAIELAEAIKAILF